MSTKKLARELGFVRQRSKSTSGTKKAISNQIFSYLIVIDFESTCWREKNNLSQEIIEFPAVLLNTCTGEVESEFQTYVQPQERPVLSEFCTELTGITQAQVEAGVPLAICLSQFRRWLQKLQLQIGLTFPSKEKRETSSSAPKLCTFLTWSDWDLGVCLQYECKRKQIFKPDVLNSWIDLRSTYKLFYNRKPKGLNGALQDLGIQFSGREHSGLDDARNTAHLAVRMMRDGCLMKITRSLDRMPPVVRPGNATDDKKCDQAPEKFPITSKSLPTSKIHLKSHEPNSDPPSVRTLVPLRTLLDSTNLPRWGLNNVKTTRDSIGKLPTAAVSPNNMIMCSTVLSHPPDVDSISNPDHLITEEEERCGSYDDAVLEEEDVTVETETRPWSLETWDDESVANHCRRPKERLEDETGSAGAAHTLSSNHGKVASQPRSVFVAPRFSLKEQTHKTSKKNDFLPEKTSTPNGSLLKSAAKKTSAPFVVFADPEIQSGSRAGNSSCTSTSVASRSSPSVTFRGSFRGSITAPLCDCGRRAKRQVVSSFGPNQGRGFFCCAVRRSGSGCRVQKGCGFFAWESTLMRSRAAGASVSMMNVSVKRPQSAMRKSY